MIDDAFARGYCFNIAAPDTSRPHAIGLGFVRADRKRGHVDIEGTVWIDSVSRSLTDIVFHYVGLDKRSERLRPGGRIEFRTMQNGATMIDRWYLRFPAVKPNAPMAPGGLTARGAGIGRRSRARALAERPRVAGVARHAARPHSGGRSGHGDSSHRHGLPHHRRLRR